MATAGRERLTGAYELRQVEFRYDPQAAPTVDIPALAIQPGQHVAVLGTNGSGKSTTVNMITGLLEPSDGQILFNGKPIHHDLTGQRSSQANFAMNRRRC